MKEAISLYILDAFLTDHVHKDKQKHTHTHTQTHVIGSTCVLFNNMRIFSITGKLRDSKELIMLVDYIGM